MVQEIFDLLFKRKPATILIAIKNSDDNTNLSSISNNINCTFCHVTNVVQQLQKLELVNTKKVGRTKILQLTPKGENIVGHIEAIYGELK